jgi:ABC-2 type transport system permease protein
VSATTVRATAVRVLLQLRHDPRTVVLLLGVPVMLLVLMKWVFNEQEQVFQRVGLPLVGLFPLVSMFIVTSITMLRERTGGTLERLMTLPISKLDLLLGYAVAFGAFAAVQAVLAAFIAVGALGLHTEAELWVVVALAILNALHGMALGLFVSAFARSEFQAVQFMPALLLPQILLSGLLTPRSQMARPIEVLSDFLPLSYAYDALERSARLGGEDASVLVDTVVVLAATAVALVLGAATLRRRTP